MTLAKLSTLPILSTATQTIQFLNELYNIFDKAIDNYDVYKVLQGRSRGRVVARHLGGDCGGRLPGGQRTALP